MNRSANSAETEKKRNSRQSMMARGNASIKLRNKTEE